MSKQSLVIATMLMSCVIAGCGHNNDVTSMTVSSDRPAAATVENTATESTEIVAEIPYEDTYNILTEADWAYTEIKDTDVHEYHDPENLCFTLTTMPAGPLKITNHNAVVFQFDGIDYEFDLYPMIVHEVALPMEESGMNQFDGIAKVLNSEHLYFENLAIFKYTYEYDNAAYGSGTHYEYFVQPTYWYATGSAEWPVKQIYPYGFKMDSYHDIPIEALTVFKDFISVSGENAVNILSEEQALTLKE